MKLFTFQCLVTLLLAVVCLCTLADDAALPASSYSNHTESADTDNVLNTFDERSEVSPDHHVDVTVDGTAEDMVAVEAEELPVIEEVFPDKLLEKFDSGIESHLGDSQQKPDEDRDNEEELGSGLDLEGLLDQLDAAISELQTVKDERTTLANALKEKDSTELMLHDQIAALKAELAYINATAADLRMQVENYQSSIQSGQESTKEVAQSHEAEKQVLLDQLAIAERNASSLAIKVKLERNERTISKLSYENCLLELDGVRSGQLDEVAELKTELATLKRTRETKCKPCSVTKREGGATGTTSTSSSSGECDTSACIDSFVSKYLFFWAKEHQSPEPTPVKKAASPDASKTSGSTEQSKHSMPQTPKPPRNADGTRNLQYEEVMSYLQFGMRVAMIGAEWVGTQCSTYIYPVLHRVISYEIEMVCTIVRVCVKAVITLWDGYLSPAWFNTVLPSLQEFHTNQILPLYMTHVHPLYTAYAESTVKAVFAYYERHEDWFDQHVGDPLDFIIGRLHYAFYFTAVFFSPEEIGHNLQEVWHYMQVFVPTVIEQLCSIEPLQAQLGAQCEVIMSICVYCTVALFLYLSRRVIFGMVALVAMLVLSPALLAVYLLAKMAALFKPRKKSSKRSAGAGASSSHSGSGTGSGGGGGGGRQTSKYPPGGSGSGGNLSSSSAGQLSTRNFPMNAPVINPAPGPASYNNNPVSTTTTSSASNASNSAPIRSRPRSDGPPTSNMQPARPSAVSRSTSSSSQPPTHQIYSRHVVHSGHNSNSEEAALGV